MYFMVAIFSPHHRASMLQAERNGSGRMRDQTAIVPCLQFFDEMPVGHAAGNESYTSLAMVRRSFRLRQRLVSAGSWDRLAYWSLKLWRASYFDLPCDGTRSGPAPAWIICRYYTPVVC